jgi:hypothetical protein
MKHPELPQIPYRFDNLSSRMVHYRPQTCCCTQPESWYVKMRESRERWNRVGILVVAALVVVLLVIPGIHAEPLNQSMLTGSNFVDALNANNAYSWDISHPLTYHENLKPVTLFRAEWNETSLPGPRYMAFGPSVIAVTIDPLILVVILATVALCGVAWYIVRHRQDAGDDKE